MLAAAIDIGTNSCRLLIVDYKNKDDYRIVKRKLITSRLGEGVDKNKFLNKAAIKRTLSAIKKFLLELNNCGVDKNYVKVAGTSALRDVNNSDKLVERINKQTGLKLKVISGDEEAYLTYRGVDLDFKDDNNLIIDIGGGSTEFIWQKGGEINFKSLNIGAVRMTERYIENPAQIIPGSQLRLAQNRIREVLLNNFQEIIVPEKIIGTGGTISTLAAIDLDLKEYNYDKVHLHKIGREKIEQILCNILSKEIEERREINGLQPQRADIIPAGIIILLTILDFLDRIIITYSEHDLLFGLIREIVGPET